METRLRSVVCAAGGLLLLAFVGCRSTALEDVDLSREPTTAEEMLATLRAIQETKRPPQKTPELESYLGSIREALDHDFPGGISQALGVRRMLGLAYMRLQDFSDAETQLSLSLGFHRTLLGNEHILTVENMSELGYVKIRQGKWDEGEALLSESLEGKRRLQGEDHPSTEATRELLETVRSRPQQD